MEAADISNYTKLPIPKETENPTDSKIYTDSKEVASTFNDFFGNGGVEMALKFQNKTMKKLVRSSLTKQKKR